VLVARGIWLCRLRLLARRPVLPFITFNKTTRDCDIPWCSTFVVPCDVICQLTGDAPCQRSVSACSTIDDDTDGEDGNCDEYTVSSDDDMMTMTSGNSMLKLNWFQRVPKVFLRMTARWARLPWAATCWPAGATTVRSRELAKTLRLSAQCRSNESVKRRCDVLPVSVGILRGESLQRRCALVCAFRAETKKSAMSSRAPSALHLNVGGGPPAGAATARSRSGGWRAASGCTR